MFYESFQRKYRHLHSDAVYIVPLFIYKYNMLQETETPKPNFTKKFYKEYLDTLSFKPAPEYILNYIYAVLHCPKYRKTYIEFLKTGFPSVPMTKNKWYGKEETNVFEEEVS